MTEKVVRRRVLQGLIATGIAGFGGCNFGDSADSGVTGNERSDGSTTGSGTPTPEPLTWPEATREVLGDSDRAVLRGTESAPDAIGSRSDARRAFVIVGWHRSIQNIDAGQRQEIDKLLQRGPEVERQISEAESSLSEVDSLISEMKDTTIPLTGQTVWDTAVSLSPSLQGFDRAVDEMLDELGTWQRLLADVIESVGTVRESIQAVESGDVSRASSLSRQAERAVEAIDDLETRSSELRRTLSEYATVAEQVASVADQLGPLAGEVGRVYGETGRQLDRAASDLREFNGMLRGTRSTLSTMRSNARGTVSELLARAEELVGPTAGGDGDAEGTPTPTPGAQKTPTDTPLPQNPRADPDVHQGFEEGLGDWRGDTELLEQTTDAARGSRAVRLGPGFAQITLNLPETSRRTYSFWWKVASESAGLSVTFNADATALFGMEVRDGPDALELVVNHDAADDASDLLYAQIRKNTWYNLTFTSVDFDRQEFEVVLYDIGDLELVRAQQSFAGNGQAVSSMSVELTDEDPVFLDDVRVS